MKVLFVNRFDSDVSPGGDTTQMYLTKKNLEKLGLTIDVSLGGKVNYSEYDLIHVFNIMRPFESTRAIASAKDAGKPVVMSSIYWDFSEFNKLGRDSRVLKFLDKHFDEFTVEKFKDLVRFYPMALTDSKFYMYFLSDVKKTLKLVDLFLPNSKSEGELLKERIDSKVNYSVVNNAVDKDKFGILTAKRKREAIVAARIDPRKNILNLVKSNPSINTNVYGNVSDNHNGYYEEIIKANRGNFTFHGHVNSNDLPMLYNSHFLHILPSWLETPGLSQLEAAACGCNIVSTDRGSAKDYFGKFANYCDPSDLNSIRNSIELSLSNPVNPKVLSEHILDNYTWEHSAEQTLEAYAKLINTN